MIKKAIKKIKNIFIPPIEYRNFEEDDKNIVDYANLEAPIQECGPSHFSHGISPYGNIPPENRYTGVPAPVYLKEDEWFGPAPEYTENQKDYMERETEIKRQEFEKSFSIEPEDIHQRMYEIATKNHNTTLHLNPLGGSENFHEGPGGWKSGNGWGTLFNE